MCKLKQPWRHAASIIVSASRKSGMVQKPYSHPLDPTAEILDKVIGEKKVGPTSTNDLSILMVKRRGDSKFMPGVYTFPGGALHPSDFATHWADQFIAHIYDKEKDWSLNPNEPIVKQEMYPIYLNEIENKPGRPPAMVEFREFNRKMNQKLDRNTWMPGEWAFKLCALRELFEETGILVCKDLKTGLVEVKSSVPSAPDYRVMPAMSYVQSLDELRMQVVDDAEKFKDVCSSLNVLPAWWLLREWSNWLSPSTYSARHRFDTLFYVLAIERQEIAIVQESELDKAEVD